MTDSFILGLSSGSTCLVTCGMVFFPYLMAGAAGTKKIVIDLSVFLLTRLLIYGLLATISWYFGQTFFTNPLMKNVIPGILYIFFAVLLVWYSISKNRKAECPAKIVTEVNNRKLVPIFLGIINSLGFCPALFIILTKGATESALLQSYIAFLAFFLGSSLWFLPLPLFGKVRKKKIIETIGILATGLAGIIFIIKGLAILTGGLING
jgi:hypothetical protein